MGKEFINNSKEMNVWEFLSEKWWLVIIVVVIICGSLSQMFS